MSQGLPSNRAELPSSCTAVSDGTVVKNLPVNVEDARDMGLTPGLERSPGVGNGKSLQDPCLGILCTEKPGSPWGHKELDMTERTF